MTTRLVVFCKSHKLDYRLILCIIKISRSLSLMYIHILHLNKPILPWIVLNRNGVLCPNDIGHNFWAIYWAIICFNSVFHAWICNHNAHYFLLFNYAYRSTLLLNALNLHNFLIVTKNLKHHLRRIVNKLGIKAM